MRWLAECSAEALGEALRVVAPELSGYLVTVPVPDPAAQRDSRWWSGRPPSLTTGVGLMLDGLWLSVCCLPVVSLP